MTRVGSSRSSSIRSKVAALLLLAAAVPLVVAAALQHRVAAARVTDDAVALLDARADQLATELDAFHDQYARIAARAARLPTTARYFGPERERARAEVEGVLATIAGSDPRVRGVAVFEADGTISLGTEPPLLGRSYAFRGYFQRAMRGEASIADVYVAVPEVGSVPSIAYASPVVTPDGAVRGAFVIFVRAAAFWDLVRRGDGRAGEGSFAVLYDRLGVRIAHSREEGQVFRPAAPLDASTLEQLVAERRFGDRTRELLSAPIPMAEAFARARAPQVDGGPIRATSAVLGPCLGVGRRLASTPWTLLVFVPETTLAAPASELARHTVLALLGVTGCALLAGLWASGLVVRRVRALADAAAALGRGDLSARVDAHGDDELAALAAELNRAATSLEASRRDLERRVDERTQALRRANDDLAARHEDLARREAREQAFGRALLAIARGPNGCDLEAAVSGALREVAGVTGLAALGCVRDGGDGRLAWVGGWGVERGGPVPAAGLLRDALAQGHAVVVDALPPDLPLRFELGLAAGPLRAAAVVPFGPEGARTGALLAGALARPAREALALLEDLGRALAPAIAEHELRADLRARNEELTAQTEELRRQRAELEARRAELQAKNAELEAQQRALRAKGAEVELANRHKSEFLANMSHELRTPLNAVIGFADLVREEAGARLEAAHRRYLDEILAGGRHLLALIGEVLDLSKIEAGRMELALEQVDVAQVVAEAVALVEPATRPRAVWVEPRLAPGLTALADRARLRQVLVNLMANAVKFSPDRSRVELTAREGEGAVRFEVRDHGPGIPPEVRPRLFQPFTQGEDPLTKRHEGTGLGLAISRRLVELHGGAIWLEDPPGGGTSVVFTLPAAGPAPAGASGAAGSGPPRPGARRVVVVERPQDGDEAVVVRLWLAQAGYEVVVTPSVDEAVVAARRPDRPAVLVLDAEDARGAAASVEGRDVPVVVATGRGDVVHRGVLLDQVAATLPAEGAAPGARVLVIDDDPRVAEVLRAAVEPRGYRVDAATTGEEGLRLARAAPPDLIVVDLLLPGISGFEVIEALAADERTSDRPILVLTAADLTLAQRRWLAEHARALAEKGDLTREALLASIREAMRREGAGAAPAAGPAGPVTVLVVDDHDVNRALVKAILEGGGYRVLSVADAPSGVELARRDRPAVVLMDIAMPGMDGFAALAALRAAEDTRDIPVAAVTALAMRSDEARIRAAGFDDYVTKPIERATLLEVVARLARRPAPGATRG